MVVFNLTKPGNIFRALLGDFDIGTHINSLTTESIVRVPREPAA